MKKKYKLSHLVLYAKGWYKKSDNIWEDLIKILELDGYSPYNIDDVYNIILSSLDSSEFTHRFTELREVLYGIYPSNCWKYGYYVKENKDWANTGTVIHEYVVPTAFIYYVLGNLRFLDNTYWIVKTPIYKKYPKPSHITVKQVIDTFNKKIPSNS